MGCARPRPIEGMQRIMTTFKHFDKKLDKLQNDLKFHGETLSDLRSMMTRISGASIVSPDRKTTRRPHKRQAPITEYVVSSFQTEDDSKPKKKKAAHPQPVKTKTSSFEYSQDKRLNPDSLPKMQSKLSDRLEFETSTKHAQRHKKAEVLKKENTRPKKIAKKIK